jgi:hypothetical protein
MEITGEVVVNRRYRGPVAGPGGAGRGAWHLFVLRSFSSGGTYGGGRWGERLRQCDKPVCSEKVCCLGFTIRPSGTLVVWRWVAVGTVVVAVLLPIFQLNQLVGKF